MKERERIYSCTERQLKHYDEPGPGLFICESAKVIRRALEAGYQPVSLLREHSNTVSPDVQDISDMMRQASAEIFCWPHEQMKALAGYALTGGVLSAMRRRPLPSPEVLCRGARRLAIVDDVENPTNLGAIFRAAAALGMDGIILTAGCTDPLYRRCIRVSMGTVFQIPWTFAGEDLAHILHEAGFRMAALALRKDAKDLGTVSFSDQERWAMVLGNEDHGISDQLLSCCDEVVRIPMAGDVDSLNVGAAAAVAFWEVCKSQSFAK